MGAACTVRARSAYCSVRHLVPLAGKPAESDLDAQAASGVPGTIPGASLQAPYFYRSPGAARLSLAVEIPSDSIRFSTVKGRPHAEVNILGIAYNSNAAVAARFGDTVKLDFADNRELDEFLRWPFLNYEKQFDLAPDSYDLKVLFSSGGEEFGEVEKNPLIVDAYDGRALFLSGIALGTALRQATGADAKPEAGLPGGRMPLEAQGMRITQAGGNRFRKSGHAFCYLEVYEPLLGSTAAAAAGVTVEIRMLDAKTGEARTDTGPIDVTGRVQPGNPTIPLAFRLKVEQLAAGSYIAEFRVADSTHRILARKVPIEVVE